MLSVGKNVTSCVIHHCKGYKLLPETITLRKTDISVNRQKLNKVCGFLSKNSSVKCVRFRVCHFHTSPKRYFDPALWPVVRNILKGSGIISGRGFRKWWQSLPDKKRQYFIHSARKKRQEVALLIGFLGVCFYIYYRTHLQVAPLSGRQRFIAFTDYQFKKISMFQAEQMCNKLKADLLPVNHIYYNVVLNTVNHLIHANQDIEEIKDIKWTVAIVDSPAVNAFVLPTGHVFVHTGLLKFVQDQDQLAIVLAHEMAHALLKHGSENLSRVQLVDYFVISIMTFLWALMPTDGIAIVTHWFLNKVVNLMLNLPYSRFLETEADKVGLELAAKACYDIRCGTVFWTLMDLCNKVEGGGVPEWKSTHPASHKRAELFDCLLHKYLHVRHECDCPPLPDKDPRHILHSCKLRVDNILTGRKARANIERFKIPLPNFDHEDIAMSSLNNFKKREFRIEITMLPNILEEKRNKKSESKQVVVPEKDNTKSENKVDLI